MKTKNITVTINFPTEDCEYTPFFVYHNNNRPCTEDDLNLLNEIFSCKGGFTKALEDEIQFSKKHDFIPSIELPHPETGSIVVELNPYPIKGNTILTYMGCGTKRMLRYASQIHLDHSTVAMLMGY